MGDASRTPGELDPESDALLLERFPASRDIEAVLLSAFAWAFGRQVGRPFRVEIQAHGRWPRHGIDPTFCVGWFASLHTLELPVAQDDLGVSLLGAARVALRSVHEGFNESESSERKPRTRMEYRSIIEDPYRSEAIFPILDVLWWNPPHSDLRAETDLVLISGHRRGRLWWQVTSNPRVYATQTVIAMAHDIASYLRRAATAVPNSSN